MSSVTPDDGCITLSSDNDDQICYLPPTDSSSRRRRLCRDDDRWGGNPDVFQTASRGFSSKSSLLVTGINWCKDNGRRSRSKNRSHERKRRNSSTMSSSPERIQGKKRKGDDNRYSGSNESGKRSRSRTNCRKSNISRTRSRTNCRKSNISRSRSRTYCKERKINSSRTRPRTYCGERNTSRSSTSSKRWSEANSSGRMDRKNECSASVSRSRKKWNRSYRNEDRSDSYSRSESRGREDRECNSSRSSVSRDEGFQLERKIEVHVKSDGKFSSSSIGDRGKINVQRKGEKKTFYCDLCLIELNSEDTKNSHVNGAKHSKMLREYTDKIRKYAARGKILPEKGVYQIANPEAIRKKIPIRLHEKIKQSADPVVGLDYIKEFIAFSDPEMEPFYDCELCGSQGHANMIFGHIMGSKHRQKFAEIIFKNEIRNGRVNYMYMKQKELMKFANEFSENSSKISSRIRSTVSDNEYPWPPGKAPWSIEKGGNGVAPDGARKCSEGIKMEIQNVTQSPHREIQSKNSLKPTFKLPPPWKLKAPQNFEEVVKYLYLGSRMIQMAVDFNKEVGELTKIKLKYVLDGMTNGMKKETSEHL